MRTQTANRKINLHGMVNDLSKLGKKCNSFQRKHQKFMRAVFRKWCKVSSVEWATHVSGLKVCAAAGPSSSPSL